MREFGNRERQIIHLNKKNAMTMEQAFLNNKYTRSG